MNKEAVMNCPFCGKETIKVVIQPSYAGFKTSRGSGVSTTYAATFGEKYFVLNACPECGKSKAEVERGLFG